MTRVLCHGCFDVLHAGHIRLLKFAHTLGQRLIVSIASDEHIRHWKGRPPANSQEYRREVLESFDFVERVIVTDGLGVEATCKMLEIVRPDVYVKGNEYKDMIAEKEKETVERYGRVVFFPEFDKARCSTSVIQKVR